MNIAIDGFALGLKNGTGLTTYARELAHTLSGHGHTVSAVYGLNGLGLAPELLWPRFVQTLSTRGECHSQAWPVWAPRAAWYLTRHLLRWPLRPRLIAANPAAAGPSRPDRFPDLHRVYNIPSVYRAAQAYSAVLRTPLTIRRLPGVEVFHRTFPLPVRMRGVANVVTAHDAIPLTLPYSTPVNLRHYRRILRQSLRQADRVFVVSEHSKRDLLNLFDLRDDRLEVTYQSVDIPVALRRFDPDRLARFLAVHFHLTPGGYFLFYGAIEPKKNVSRLLDAHALCQADLPLVVAGPDGWLHESVDQRLDTLGRNRRSALRIRRVPHLPYQQLMLLLKGARALVFPSLYEGFGLPVLEAMRMGVPVITSTAASLPEVAGDAALLVDPYDPVAIATAMDRLAGDNVLCTELVAKGQARAEFFSPERHLQRLEAGYRRAMGG